jgi:hypothetical protein
MPCHAMHPIQDFFWNVFFHMYYNLICNFLYTLLFAQNSILVKSGCYTHHAALKTFTDTLISLS